MFDGSSTTNAQKNAIPVTSPGIARGYSIKYCSEPRKRNDDRCATTDRAAIASVASAPPIDGDEQAVAHRADEHRVVEHRLHVVVDEDAPRGDVRGEVLVKR